jgi:hypothetical protein
LLKFASLVHVPINSILKTVCFVLPASIACSGLILHPEIEGHVHGMLNVGQTFYCCFPPFDEDTVYPGNKYRCLSLYPITRVLESITAISYHFSS